jgi:hypothetical protein
MRKEEEEEEEEEESVESKNGIPESVVLHRRAMANDDPVNMFLYGEWKS